MLTLLQRLIPPLLARWPDVTIELRADSGFATPKLYTYCEAERIGYTIGLATNARLKELAGQHPARTVRMGGPDGRRHRYRRSVHRGEGPRR